MIGADRWGSLGGIGGGAGFSYSSEAPNVTVSADYNRVIAGPWGFTVGIGWDKEFRKLNGKRIQSQSVDLSVGITYQFMERIGLVAGFSRGLIGKERGEDWESAGSNDWAIGAGLSYIFPINDRVAVGPGFVVAYDIANSEMRTEVTISLSAAF